MLLLIEYLNTQVKPIDSHGNIIHSMMPFGSQGVPVPDITCKDSVLNESKRLLMIGRYLKMSNLDYTSSNLDFIEWNMPMFIEHILQIEPKYHTVEFFHNKNVDVSEYTPGKYCYDSKAVEAVNSSIDKSAEWKPWHPYVNSSLLLDSYTNSVNVRSSIQNVAENNTQEDRVTILISNFIAVHFPLTKHFSLAPQLTCSDITVLHCDHPDNEDYVINDKVESAPVSEHSVWELKRRIVEKEIGGKSSAGKNWHSLNFQLIGYNENNINLEPRVYGILVKGQYIIFTEYNLELFYDFHGFPPLKGNIDLATTTIRYPLKSVDFTGNIGLALTNTGVEAIPIQNTYAPQFIAYKMSSELQVFPIQCIAKMLSLNILPPTRDPLTFEIIDSFPNKYIDLNKDTVLISNMLKIKPTGELIWSNKV